jgi:hypothetical protein
MKTPLALFYETVDALGQMTDATERNRLSRDIFGRGWTEMIQVFQQGSAAIKAAGEAVGKSITDEDIQRATDYRLSLKSLGSVWDSLVTALGRGIVGTIAFMVNGKGWGEDAGTWSGQGTGVTADAAASAGLLANTTASAAPPAPDPFLIQVQQRAIFAAQSNQMIASAQLGLATSPTQTLAAQRALITATTESELAKFAIEAHSQNYSPDQIASRQGAMSTVAQDAIAKLTRAEITQLGADLSKAYAVNAGAVASDLADNPPSSGISGDADVSAWQAAADFPALKTFDYIRKGWEDTGKFITSASEDAESHIVEVSAWSADEIMKNDARQYVQRKQTIDQNVQDQVDAWMKTQVNLEDATRQQLAVESGKFVAIKRNYDDDVTAAINANLLKLNLYKDDGQKQLDIAAGTYNALQARQAQYFANLATCYQMVAERDGDVWAAMRSGAVTTYASLGTFWGNVSKGFADTFSNVQKSLSDGFFDVMTGNFKDLGTVAENFGKSMVRTFADILANAATRELLGLLLGTGTGTVGGALGLGVSAVGAATGTGGGAGGAGGVVGDVSTGGGLLGLANTLSGGSLYSGISSLFGGGATAGVTYGSIVSPLGEAIGASTAEASDLGLLSATTLSNTGAAVGTTAATTAATTATTTATDVGLSTLGTIASYAVPAAAFIGAGLMAYSDFSAASAAEAGYTAQFSAMASDPAFMAAFENRLNTLPGIDDFIAGNIPYLPTGVAGDGFRLPSYSDLTGVPGTDQAGLRLVEYVLSNYPGTVPKFAQAWTDMLAYMSANGSIGTTGDSSGRASGGPVWPGLITTVAEQGPEPVVWGANGYVLGHQEASDIFARSVSAGAGGGSGGGGTVIFDFRGSTMLSEIPDKIIKQISAALPWRERYLRVRR